MNLNRRSAKEYSARKKTPYCLQNYYVSFSRKCDFGIVRKHWKKPIAWETLSNWPAQDLRHVEQPITAVGDKKLSTDFHTPLKTERLQKPGPKPYRQQTTVKAKITEWPITTRSSEEVCGGGEHCFTGWARASPLMHYSSKWKMKSAPK